jgi:hypothetical protein
MDTRKLWILAGLLIAGCGGSNEPSTTVAEGDQAAVAEVGAVPEAAGTVAEPELIATSPSGASPTSERFQMGVHYLRLSPTQPTSSGPDEVEVAEIFWYGCPALHLRRFSSARASIASTRASFVSRPCGSAAETHAAFTL